MCYKGLISVRAWLETTQQPLMRTNKACILFTVNFVLKSVYRKLEAKCPLGRTKTEPRMKERPSTFYSLDPDWYTLELSEDTVLPCWGLIPNTISKSEASAGWLKYLCSPRLRLLSPPIVLHTIVLYECVC